MSTVTAGWPLPKLLAALARAGWADLDTGAAQGIRSTLRALADLLPERSALGQVTTNQVADAAGLSSRWTARCLHYLEEVGLITWTRGQLLAGVPTPGVIKVNKGALALLIRKARRQISDRVRARADETARRIRETLRKSTQLNRPAAPAPTPWYMRNQRPEQQKPLSERVELRSTLTPQGEETTALRPVEPTPATPTTPGYRRAQLRAAIQAAKEATR